MGRPSNPRLMARVLEAVGHLAEGKGSSARHVLEIVRQGNNAPTRNLAMQVHRALKNAVTAGLLQLRSGRYRMLIALQPADNNRGENGGKIGGISSAARRKEDYENGTESGSPQPLQAGPKSRCSHCKKHKRQRSSRRKRKRSSKGRRRPTKQAKERNSRKLRRQGDEEASNRRERRKKMPSPGARGQSEVPDGKRSERKGKTSKDNDQDCDTQESARRSRSSSRSDTEDEEESATATRAKLNPGARKNASSTRRRTSSRRRNSKKRNSSQQGTRASDKDAENDCEEATMECCDDDPRQVEDAVDDQDARNTCEENTGSRTSL